MSQLQTRLDQLNAQARRLHQVLISIEAEEERVRWEKGSIYQGESVGGQFKPLGIDSGGSSAQSAKPSVDPQVDVGAKVKDLVANAVDKIMNLDADSLTALWQETGSASRAKASYYGSLMLGQKLSSKDNQELARLQAQKEQKTPAQNTKAANDQAYWQKLIEDSISTLDNAKSAAVKELASAVLPLVHPAIDLLPGLIAAGAVLQGIPPAMMALVLPSLQKTNKEQAEQHTVQPLSPEQELFDALTAGGVVGLAWSFNDPKIYRSAAELLLKRHRQARVLLKIASPLFKINPKGRVNPFAFTAAMTMLVVARWKQTDTLEVVQQASKGQLQEIENIVKDPAVAKALQDSGISVSAVIARSNQLDQGAKKFDLAYNLHRARDARRFRQRIQELPKAIAQERASQNEALMVKPRAAKAQTIADFVEEINYDKICERKYGAQWRIAAIKSEVKYGAALDDYLIHRADTPPQTLKINGVSHPLLALLNPKSRIEKLHKALFTERTSIQNNPVNYESLRSKIIEVYGAAAFKGDPLQQLSGMYRKDNAPADAKQKKAPPLDAYHQSLVNNYGKLVARDMDPVSMMSSPGNLRGYAIPPARIIEVGPQKGEIIRDTAWHELSHLYEKSHPDIEGMSRAFRSSRSGQFSPGKVIPIAPKFMPGEFSVEAGFARTYVGKVMGFDPQGSGATEVLSMGVGSFGSTASLDHLLTHDREHALYALGAIKKKSATPL